MLKSCLKVRHFGKRVYTLVTVQLALQHPTELMLFKTLLSHHMFVAIFTYLAVVEL